MKPSSRMSSRFTRRSRWIPRMDLTLAVLLVGLATVAVAQTGPKEAPKTHSALRSVTRGLGAVRPSRKSSARWPVGGFNRVVHIHQADGTDIGAKGLYFYRPLLAFEENPTPIAGYPPIVLKAQPQTGGAVKLTFAVRLGLAAFREVAKLQIQRQDAQSLQSQHVRPEQVKVEPWPISHAIIDCKLEGDDEPLASGQTESLASIHDQIPFTLTFTPEALEKFKKGVAHKEVFFTFCYTFEGRKIAEGSAVSEAVKDVRTVVDQVVRSHLTPGQRQGIAPVFQQHLNAIERDIRVRLYRVIRAQHKDLFPVLGDSSASVVGRLFELDREYTMDELQGDKTLSDAVTQYLRPLVETWAASDARSTDLSQEDERKRSEVRKRKGNLGFEIPLPLIKLSAGGSEDSTTTTERRNLLKTEYGVETKRDASGQFYVPYSVKVFKYNSGKQVADIEDVQVAFLAVGEADQYLQDTPVPAHFTVEKLKDLIARAGAKPQTVASTIEAALTAAVADLGTARDRLEKAKKACQLAAAELTVSQNTLAAARARLASTSAKVAQVRRQRNAQEALVQRMPKEVPKKPGGRYRAPLGGGPARIPMQPNPDLPAAKQKLSELNTAVEHAVAAEAAAKVRVEQAEAAVAEASTAAEQAQRERDAAQAKFTMAAARAQVLRELSGDPPAP